MDRFRFLLMALLVTAISAAQLGCGGDTSGEYRTFAQSQADGELPGDAEVGDVTSEPTRDVEPSDTPVVLDEAADSLAASTVPIEPEMTPENEAVSSDADDLLVVKTVPATDAEPAGAVVPADDTGPPSDPTPPDKIASDGSTIPGSPNVTGPTAADPAETEPIEETSLPVRLIELLIPEQTFSPEGPEQALRVSYDDLDLLKVLNMEPVPEDAASHFPQWLSRLNGERIRIRGFMYPTFQESDLPGFVLARDNEICCFGRNPKIYDLIEVSMRDGVTTDYIQGRPFDVVGVFRINLEADEDGLYQLYQIDDAVVADR